MSERNTYKTKKKQTNEQQDQEYKKEVWEFLKKDAQAKYEAYAARLKALGEEEDID